MLRGCSKGKGLNKSISNQGWYKFIQYMDYKLTLEGKYLIQVDRYYPSSKKCSSCDSINYDLTLSQRSWECDSCNEIHSRDLNASKNILKEGLRIGQELPEFKLVESCLRELRCGV